MPKLDLSKIDAVIGSDYPGKLAAEVGGRAAQRLGEAGGLTQFGVNLVRLMPGDLSSLRHYHMQQDEFLMVTTGVCTLIDDDGEQDLLPGDCACFPAGDANPHHLVNKTDKPAAFLVVGTHTPTETAIYGDIDMMVTNVGAVSKFTRKNGSPLTADQTGEDK